MERHSEVTIARVGGRSGCRVRKIYTVRTSGVLRRWADVGRAEQLLRELAAAYPEEALRSVTWSTVAVEVPRRWLEPGATGTAVERPLWCETLQMTTQRLKRWEATLSASTPARAALVALYRLCLPGIGEFAIDPRPEEDDEDELRDEQEAAA